MTATEATAYCPYDLDLDPAALGLTFDHAATRFGRLQVVRSPRVTSEVCTLFLHGVGATWAQWTPLLREAARCGRPFHDVGLVDLPGFGGSENLLGNLAMDVVGSELLALVRRLGYPRVRVVGHSMGGFLTLDMASRRHSMIESVHVVAGAYFSIIRTVRSPLCELFESPIVTALYGGLNLMSAVGSPAGVLANIIGGTRLADPFLKPFAVRPHELKPRVRESLYQDLRPKSFLLAAQNGHGYEPQDQWSKISVPLTGVFGRQDELVPPSDMRRLAAAVPHAELTLVDDAAHLVHIERPAQTLGNLLGGCGIANSDGD